MGDSGIPRDDFRSRRMVCARVTPTMGVGAGSPVHHLLAEGEGRRWLVLRDEGLRQVNSSTLETLGAPTLLSASTPYRGAVQRTQSPAVPTPGPRPEIVLTPKILGCQKRISRTPIYRSEKGTKFSIITISQALGGMVMMMLAEPKPPPTNRQ